MKILPPRGFPKLSRITAFVSLLTGMGLLSSFGSGSSSAEPQSPKPGRTYQNPVFAGNMPDPSVKKLGAYYYAFGTTGNKRLPDGRIFTLLQSSNLVDWIKLGGALVPPPDDQNHQYWAPEVTDHQGKYLSPRFSFAASIALLISIPTICPMLFEAASRNLPAPHPASSTHFPASSPGVHPLSFHSLSAESVVPLKESSCSFLNKFHWNPNDDA